MDAIKTLNLIMRFLLEICILIIFSYWGIKTGGTGILKTVMGIGSPLVFAVIWGILLAPKSAMRLQQPWLSLLEIVIFGLAAWALYSTAKSAYTVAFGLSYILNKILMVIWKQS